MKMVIDPNGYPCSYPDCDVVSASPGAAGGHAAAHARSGSVLRREQYEAITIEAYCECGAVLIMRGETSKPLARDIEELWRGDHSGPGHSATSAGEARDIRYARKRHSQEKRATS